MAFTSALIKRMHMDGLLCEVHSYLSAGGSSGGTITSQLNRILFCKVIEKDAAAMATPAVITNSLPIGGSTGVTLVTTANKGGYVMLYAEH